MSPFARSVASHVRALVEGGSSREMYNVDDGVWESQFERQMVEEKERRRQHRSDKLKLAVSFFIEIATTYLLILYMLAKTVIFLILRKWKNGA